MNLDLHTINQLFPITRPTSKREIPYLYWSYAGFLTKTDGLRYSTDNNININTRIRNDNKLRVNDFIIRLKQHKENSKRMIMVSDNPNLPTIKLTSTTKPIILSRFANDPQLQRDLHFAEYQFVNDISGDTIFNGSIVVSFDWFYGIIHSDTFSLNYSGIVSNIANVVYQHFIDNWEFLAENISPEIIQEYMDGVGVNSDLDFTPYNIVVSTNTIDINDPRCHIRNRSLNYRNMTLKREKPLTITNPMFSDIIDYKTSNDNCFDDALSYQFSEKWKKNKPWKQLPNTYNSLIELTKIKGLGLTSYDVKGNIIDDIKPTQNLKKSNWEKHISVVIYDSHLYLIPYKSDRQNIHINMKTNLNIVDNADELMINYAKSGLICHSIILSSSKYIDFDDENMKYTHPAVQSFMIGTTTYSDNVEYPICSNILQQLGINDIEKIKLHQNNIFGIICSTKKIERPMSHFPECSRFVKGGYNFVNNDLIYSEKDWTTIDMTKAYPYALRNLSYLTTYDIKIHKTIKYTGQEIVPEFLYYVVPECSSLVFPNDNLYHGHHILTLQQLDTENLIKFEIVEYYETEKHENPYTDIIDELLEKFPYGNEYHKFIMGSINRYIGCMSIDKTNDKRTRYYPDRITGLSEIMNCGNENIHSRKIDDDLFLTYLVDTKHPSIKNDKTNSIDVFDSARMNIFKYLIQNGVSGDKIKQIKTDSITFYSKGLNIKIDDPSVFGGFKLEPYKPISKSTPYRIKQLDLVPPKLNNGKIRRFFCAYAGSGKSKEIMTELIPSIKERKENYIILTPTYKSLTGFAKCDDCGIIHSWSKVSEFTDFDNIIVDECGMICMNAWDVLITLAMLGKNIYCYGDFTQLPPVGQENEKSSDVIIPTIYGNLNPDFFHWFFTEITNPMDYENLRNDFTWDYYNLLKNNKLCALKEVIRHETEKSKSQYIFTHRKLVRNEANYERLCELGYHVDIKRTYVNDDDNDDAIDIIDDINRHKIVSSKIINFAQKGVRIIADLTDNRDTRGNNNVRHRGIFNSMEYTILNRTGNNVILDNFETFSVDEIERYFQPAYAINIYKAQGQSILSYHWDKRDNYFLEHSPLRNIMAYVIVSRLKTKDLPDFNKIRINLK